MDREVLPQEEKVCFKGLFLVLMQLFRWTVAGDEMGRFESSFAKPSLWQETR